MHKIAEIQRHGYALAKCQCAAAMCSGTYVANQTLKSKPLTCEAAAYDGHHRFHGIPDMQAAQVLCDAS